MKTVYVSFAVAVIRRLRDEIPCDGQTAHSSNLRRLSHEAVLGGPKATCTSFTVNRSGKMPQVPKRFNGKLI